MRLVGILVGVVVVILLIQIGLVGVAIFLPSLARARLQGGDLVQGLSTGPGIDADTVAIICIATVITISLLVKGALKAYEIRAGKDSQDRNLEETQLIQEIHRSMTRMEERIEALETLWMEKSREDSFLHKL